MVADSGTRVLLVSAYGPEARRGNASTCARYLVAARAAGLDVAWTYADGAALPAALDRSVRTRTPALVHGHHLLRVGPAVRALGIPYVVSDGGTEFELLARTPAAEADLRAATADARLVLFSGEAARAAWTARGFVDASRARVVSRGVAAPATAPPPRDPAVRGALRLAVGVAADAFLVLVVAGIRAGKDPLRALAIHARLRKEVPSAACVILGAPLDAGLAAEVRAAAARTPGAFVSDPVAPEAMPAVYADADVVLNTSRVEGVANALLEAQAAARPVLASAIPANAQVVAEGAGGATFVDDDAAVATLAAWALDAGLRRELGRGAHAFVARAFTVEREADLLVAAYREALSGA